MSPARFAVNNRALIHAAMILVIVIGLIAYFAIPRELTSKVGFNWGFIIVEFPGANPQEVEDLVVVPIEDEMESLDDVDVITSRSRRGRGFVWVRFEQIDDETFERRLDDIRARLAKVDLPDGSEDPLVQEFSSYSFEPVVSLVVVGTAPERVLHDLTDDLQRALRNVDGVDEVTPFGDRERVFWVECDPRLLESYRLDITDVESALRRANLNLPAGVIKLGGEEYLLRTRSQFSAADEIADVTLRAGADGSKVRLRDVATVSDDFEDRTLISEFDGKPSISLAITKREDGNTLDIVNGVRDVSERWRDRLPEGVELIVTNDQSVRIGHILGVLQSNAILGMILVIVALWIFIGWRGAAVAAIGIPVTFLIAIALMYWTGQTLNGNTLFGLILVLGMVVDDAVVVLENAFRHLEKGKDRVQAVIDGVGEVVSPVVISSMTTLGGFLPLVFMPGTTGKFMRIVPIVVSVVLLASLVESLLMLPCHFVEIVRETPKRKTVKVGDRWWERVYVATLRRFLPARYLVVAGSLVALVGSGLLIPLIGVDIFGGEEISSFRIFVELPDGSRLERTEEVLEEFAQRARQLPTEELEGVTLNAGIIQGGEEWQYKSHVGQVVVDLVEPQDRLRSLDDILRQVREGTANIPGPVKVEFKKQTAGPPQEAPVQIEVKGNDLTEVAAAARRLQETLRGMTGVFDIQDDLALTQRELNVVVDREAASRRNLDVTRIAQGVRSAFGGSVATTFRQANQEIDIRVRYPESFRERADSVTDMRFVNPMGDVVPFSEVAAVEQSRGPQTIRRRDGERVVTVKANIDTEQTDIGRVNRDAFAAFAAYGASYPGVQIEQGGQFKEFTESFNALVQLFAVGMLINFMLMAGLFKNWSQPFLIMAVVPLAFIGAMIGLLVAGVPFSTSTLYGFVALAGVAVNDSIVLVDFINKARRAGFSARDSLIEAGRVRLRPILLTSVTTILGLLPMAIGLGGSSGIWQPLATTIAAGLAVATVISLLVIPCLQGIIDDLGNLMGRVFSRRRPLEEVAVES